MPNHLSTVAVAYAAVPISFFLLCAYIVKRAGTSGLRDLAVVIRAWRKR
jgi:hypothetical protein